MRMLVTTLQALLHSSCSAAYLCQVSDLLSTQPRYSSPAAVALLLLPSLAAALLFLPLLTAALHETITSVLVY